MSTPKVLMICLIAIMPNMHAIIVPFMGKILLPGNIQEEVCIFHKGNKITSDIQRDSFNTTYHFSFVEPKSTQKCFILICSELSLSTECNTVQHLHVNPEGNYKLYSLYGKRYYNDQGELEGYGWDIEQLRVDETGIIPDDALIIMLDPNFVEELEAKCWDVEINTRVLPDLVISLKENNAALLAKMLVRCRCASLDLQSLHMNKSKAIKHRYGRAVAMMLHW